MDDEERRETTAFARVLGGLLIALALIVALAIIYAALRVGNGG